MSELRKASGDGGAKAAPATTGATGRALSPFQEFERLMDGYFNRQWLFRPRRNWLKAPEFSAGFEWNAPDVDVIDHDKELLVKAEIPGIDKNNLDISVSGNVLTIKGSKKEERKEEKDNYFMSEIRSGSFARTLTLPAEVDSDKVKARYENGVLELTLPKSPNAARRTIKVS